MGATRGGLSDRRVLITGAARGIGALLAKRLTDRGARVALAGIELDELAKVARVCRDAPVFTCDVGDIDQVDAAVAGAVDALGGLDIAVANAGVAAQLPLVGGDPTIFGQIMKVNAFGAYYTARAVGAHLSHDQGYLLLTASAAAAVHAPLLGAYSASKAAVEALGDTLRIELAPTGCKVGVAYFAQMDTDMVRRGFGTEAAKAFTNSAVARVTPVEAAIDALEAGIDKRSRRIVAPGWVAPMLHLRMVAQRILDVQSRRGVARALAIARDERAGLTTPQG
ncbi:MAG TPA: SDR family NAD(P)-dependent oxidoreductase [Acidimicrobiales bacterium]|nr:SDR family NAD(P)-dependent oxidoreductase [Acidimicrobiales bacterium]